jgi:hypothetical protein
MHRLNYNIINNCRAKDWSDASHQVWVGKLQVVAKGKVAIIKLISPDGKEFARAPVRPDGPPAVEKVTDSSRYFVLRIEDPSGRHAFIGIGFEQRDEAFDFNVALQEHEKYNVAEPEPVADLSSEPSTDYSIKEGEKIHINMNLGGEKKKKKKKEADDGGDPFSFAPPPEEPVKTKKKAAKKATNDTEDFLGMGSLSSALPPSSSPSKAAPASSDPWVSF